MFRFVIAAGVVAAAGATIPVLPSQAFSSTVPLGTTHLNAPDSLEPGPRGRVRVTHRHRKIVQCRTRGKAPKLKCRSTREDADVETKLSIKPIPDPSVAERDQRQPVEVTFPSQLQRGEKWLELPVGTWEVVWQDTAPKRFEVRDEDEFKIWLRTVTGACKPEKKECVLHPGEQSRRVVIPRRHRR